MSFRKNPAAIIGVKRVRRNPCGLIQTKDSLFPGFQQSHISTLIDARPMGTQLDTTINSLARLSGERVGARDLNLNAPPLPVPIPQLRCGEEKNGGCVKLRPQFPGAHPRLTIFR